MKFSSFSAFLHTPNHRKLILLFAAAFIELVGYFMLSPLLTLTLHHRGISDSVIGLFSATGWIALLIGAPFSALWVKKLGMQNTLRLCAVMPVLAAIAYMNTNYLALWFVVTFLGSMSSSLRWICTEAVVAALSTDQTRGRWVSAYSTLIGLTFIIGPSLLAVTGSQGNLPWWIASTLIGVGAVLTFMLHLPDDASHQDNALSVAKLLQLALKKPFLITVAVMAGFFEVGLNGILPLLGLSLRLPEAQATLLVSVSAVGGILGVITAGWVRSTLPFARKIHRCLSLLVLACTLQWLSLSWNHFIWPVVLLWGASGAAMYILLMTELGTRFSSIELVQNTSILVMAYTIGGLCAPALGGLALDWTRLLQAPVFIALTSLFAVLGWVLVYRKRKIDAALLL